jgi:hypothetical protein
MINVLENFVYEVYIKWARPIDKRVSALERVAVRWEALGTTIDAARDILRTVERELSGIEAGPGAAAETLRAVKADVAAIHEKIDLLIAWSA